MIFSAAEWSLALRYLRARREEGSLSIVAGFSLVGIALGVATLIIVMSVMGGFKIELLDRILGINGRLAVISGEAGMPNFDALAARLKQVPGVTATIPLVEGQGILAQNGHTQGVLVRGIRASDAQAAQIALKQGRLSDFGEKTRVIVGQQLLDAFGLKVGDEITLISSQTIATPLGLLPRTGRFQIVGAFEIGMYEYDTRLIYMSLEAAQGFFNLPNAATMVEIRTDKNADIALLERQVVLQAGPAGVVVNWERSNSGFFAVVQTQSNVLFLILTLIILVAAFNIVSSLFILVRTKTAEIGVLRTIGAGRGTIMRVFLLAGLILGGLGTIAGVILGVAFASNIETLRQWLQGLLKVDLFSAKLYFLTRLPAVVDYGTVAVVAFMALALTLLAALYPSWRAATLDPLAALRDE
jgi:lipoprotein-releasing system permease protein